MNLIDNLERGSRELDLLAVRSVGQVTTTKEAFCEPSIK
jgi:hypothetical protein